MSSFICTTTHFNTCEYEIINVAKNNVINGNLYIQDHGGRSLREYTKEEIAEYFAALRELNVVSFYNKYKDAEEKDTGKPIEELISEQLTYMRENSQRGNLKFDHKLKYYSRLLKLLRCIAYQVELNYMPDIEVIHIEAVEFLNGLQETLTEEIVTESEAYKNAKWAI